MPHDIFISYSHRDNKVQPEESHGWVDSFHMALENFLGEFLGREAIVWRDKDKMKGNYKLHQAVYKNLCDCLVFLPILSPSFLKSEWCPKELEYFYHQNDKPQAIETHIFPVIKTPIKSPPALLSDVVLKFEFYKNDNIEGFRSWGPAFGDDHRRKFFLIINDLAREIADFIDNLGDKDSDFPPKSPEDKPGPPDNGSGAPTKEIPVIYLAEPSPDLMEQYYEIKRDLEQRRDLGKIKFEVVIPDSQKPNDVERYKQIVRKEIHQSSVVIHLIGKENDFYPGGSSRSYLQLRTEVAAELDGETKFKRLVWIPRNITSDDENHQQFINQIREAGVDSDGLMQDSFEAFKSRIIEVLENKPSQQDLLPADDVPWVYVISDRSDLDSVSSVEKLLAEHGCAVFSSRDYLELALNDNSVINAAETHRDYLIKSDAVLIYWKNAPLSWVKKNVFDLLGVKASRNGRDFLCKAVLYLESLDNYEKARLSLPANFLKIEGDSQLSKFISKTLVGSRGDNR